MTADIVQTPGIAGEFNYAVLDTETRIVVQQRTGEIRGLMRKIAQDIVDLGLKLLEVKRVLPHGAFGHWLDAEFQWSADTAGRFMRVAERFAGKPQIAEFAPSALYLLSSRSTPEPARQEALSLAETGKTITHSVAKAIVKQHKEASKTPASVVPQGEMTFSQKVCIANRGVAEDCLEDAKHYGVNFDAVSRHAHAIIAACDEALEGIAAGNTRGAMAKCGEVLKEHQIALHREHQIALHFATYQHPAI